VAAVDAPGRGQPHARVRRPARRAQLHRGFVADNIGRPEQVALVFARPLRRPTRHDYGTRVFSAGTDVRIDFRYKHSRVQQYLKDRRAPRIETVINKPADIDVAARLHNLPNLIRKAGQVNQRLLMIERAGQSRAIGSALFEPIHQPYHKRAKEPEPCASGIHAPWLWPAPPASSCTPSPASPTKAFASSSPDTSARATTAPAR
jgi:hypothetical protein